MATDRSVLEGKAREGLGKGPSRRLRMQKLIPAVVYGKHLETPEQIAVDPIAVRKAIATPHKFNTLIELKTGAASHQVLLKDYQMDPLTRELLHADFIAVRETDQVKVKVPIVLVGKAAGVLEGGILSQARREIEVHALPSAIPERIEADVTNLGIAEVLHVNDVKMPQGVTVKSNVNYTIAVISVPEREEAATAAAAAPTAAAGAAPAAAAKKDEKKK